MGRLTIRFVRKSIVRLRSRIPPVRDPAVYPVPSEWAQRAQMTESGYEVARVAARETPDAFWSEQARRLDWMTPPTLIKDVSFDKADFRIRWFEDGQLNVAWNCLDRHLAERGDQTAIRQRSSGKATSPTSPAA